MLRSIGVRSLPTKKPAREERRKTLARMAPRRFLARLASLASAGHPPKPHPHEDRPQTPAGRAFGRFLMRLMRFMRNQKLREITDPRGKFRARPDRYLRFRERFPKLRECFANPRHGPTLFRDWGPPGPLMIFDGDAHCDNIA